MDEFIERETAPLRRSNELRREIAVDQQVALRQREQEKAALQAEIDAAADARMSRRRLRSV